ncbi:hypothetical protein QTO34_003092 [Cnephaeus nilssonii]|uniref:Uncharacterized protein n=1 Tax=Cnephaeus nilssonii TaxID=3371016 RepID=A0AA40HUD7_CNENI|nr:hypothetical protein QTO34_003092 [Eptesicus nilssonii]
MGGAPPTRPAYPTQPTSPRTPYLLRPLTQLPLWPCTAAASNHPDPLCTLPPPPQPRALLLLRPTRPPAPPRDTRLATPRPQPPPPPRPPRPRTRPPCPLPPPLRAPPTATAATVATSKPLTLPATASEATMAACSTAVLPPTCAAAMLSAFFTPPSLSICKLTAILCALIGCGHSEGCVPIRCYNGGVGRCAQAKQWAKNTEFFKYILINAENKAEFKGLDANSLVIEHIQRSGERIRTQVGSGRPGPNRGGTGLGL